MDEREKSFSPPAVGGASLLTVFAVLCLTVFALLSLSTVRANSHLGEASAEAVERYYAADRQAQEILARLRSGEEPEEVDIWGDDSIYAQYAVPMSDTQELQVEVELSLDRSTYTVLRWQVAAIGEWEIDDGLDVWDGDFGSLFIP